MHSVPASPPNPGTPSWFYFWNVCRTERVLPKSHVSAITPDAFEDGTFKEVIRHKRGHRGAALIQRDWCAWKRKELLGCGRTKKRPSEDPMTMMGDREASGESSCQHLDVGLAASRTVRKYTSGLGSPNLHLFRHLQWTNAKPHLLGFSFHSIMALVKVLMYIGHTKLA